MAEPKLVKIDRNGSKHFEGMIPCDRCHGTGRYGYYGRCFKCGGTGEVYAKWIERTPEYQSKLDDKRAKAAEKRAQEAETKRLAEYDNVREQSLAKQGFTKDGVTYLILGDTYSIKDEIKSKGGKFDPILGWHMDKKLPEYSYLTVYADEVGTFDTYGNFYIGGGKLGKAEINAWKKKVTNPSPFETPQTPTSKWIGEVGEKIKEHVTITKIYEHPGTFGMVYFYTFKDKDGNVYTWGSSKKLTKPSTFTTSIPDYYDIGDSFYIRGTIKDHREFRGEKQTVLTRCKIEP